MGIRTGRPRGRPTGSRNKASAKREAEISASGLTPLEYMLQVMRNKKLDLDTRLDAAGKAAPYVHPKLASIIHKGDAKQPVVVAGINGAEFEQIAKRLCGEV